MRNKARDKIVAVVPPTSTNMIVLVSRIYRSADPWPIPAQPGVEFSGARTDYDHHQRKKWQQSVTR